MKKETEGRTDKGQSYSYYHLVITIYRGSYMSAHVLLNLLNELGK